MLIDFIRYHENLKGTKIGCREGDCGACTVLVGELKEGEIAYRSFTSCLTPLGNVHGKHVVTVEGLNMDVLSAVQQAMYDESATQCGFCTPGFVVSLTGYCLNKSDQSGEQAIAAVDGNICRCTGYKSIQRAAEKLTQLVPEKTADHLVALVNSNLLPAYFLGMRERLQYLRLKKNGKLSGQHHTVRRIGGGTDLNVQVPEALKHEAIDFLFDQPSLKSITATGSNCMIGGSVTVTDFAESAVMKTNFPQLANYIKLVSSTPIRNMATIAGNFVNASPIGDLTIFFLALNAQLLLSNGTKNRELPLRKLYKGYKVLDLQEGEYIEKIMFPLPAAGEFFHFEKVSKRTNLDIASVNTAIYLRVSSGVIQSAGVSAGGVAPIPLYLQQTSHFLVGKFLTEELVEEAAAVADEEISPISDTRGTATYKRMLLRQLMKAHFITLFPELEAEKLIRR